MSNPSTSPTQIDHATLRPLVRAALGDATANPTHWDVALLSAHGDRFNRRSVFRVTGSADTADGCHPWSLVLKMIQGPTDTASPSTSTAHWCYWKREPLAYRAGLPGRLRDGLVAPRCFDVVDLPGDVILLWLEDVAESHGGGWPLARYGLAARHLGAFDGAHAAGMPCAPQAWYSRRWLRTRTADLGARLAAVRRPETWEHPLVRRAFPASLAAPLLRLYAERGAFLRALERLPQALCHLDAHRGNLIARDDADGAWTVAIDWAFVGHAALGEEIAALVWASLLECIVAPEDAAELETYVFEGYLAGLRETGWRGDWRAVRAGYLVNALLQWGVVPDALVIALDEENHGTLEREYRRPIGEVVERTAAATRLLLDRADEVRRLLAAQG